MSKDENDKNNENGKKGDKKGYKVGYKKPPKNRQFGAKDGNPQNRKGRPPGRNVLEFDRLSEEALWYCFHESGKKSVTIREDGEELVIPLIMAIAKGMARDSLNGDRHTRRDYLKYIEKAAKGKDKLVAEMHSILADYRERKLEAMQKPGSLKCFHTFCGWFMSKKHLRALDGKDRWPYENGEPVSEKDWAVFLRQYEYLKDNPSEVLPWPVKYPDECESERTDNMTPEERLEELLKAFANRNEEDEKEEPEEKPEEK